VKVGKYEVERVLGSGASGTVYLGVDPDGVRRALKVLPSGLRSDSSIFARFRTEIEVLRNLDHPNIVKIYEVGEESGQQFYAMEYLSGGSLAEIIEKRGAVGLGGALDVATAICSALEHAHAAGIIHRDLKPANVLLDERGQAKVVDFGIAKLTETEGVTVTRQVLGTVEYMSPEQAAGLEIDRRTDIYSLGIVLYEMLTGRVPFRSRSVAAVLKSHQYSIPESPQEWNESIPDWLNRLVLEMIAKDPARRPRSAAAVAERIGEGRASLKERRCPGCGSELETGQVVCVRCGTNVQTGKRHAVATGRVNVVWRRAFVIAAAVGIAAAGAVWSLRGLRLTEEHAAPDPALQQNHFSLGERFFQLGDLENAEKEFMRAIELDRGSELAQEAGGYLEMIESRGSNALGEQVEQNAE
jgi:serine/threonine protein kinase